MSGNKQLPRIDEVQHAERIDPGEWTDAQRRDICARLRVLKRTARATAGRLAPKIEKLEAERETALSQEKRAILEIARWEPKNG